MQETTKYIHQENMINQFESVAEQYATSLALVCDHLEVTYDDLNQRANQLAHGLVSHGVKQGHIIPIVLGPSVETVVSILGVLKTGAAFSPVDPRHPKKYLNFLLNDLDSEVIISSAEHREMLKAIRQDFKIIIPEDKESMEGFECTNLSAGRSADSLTYVIYTSGTSGVPKGVKVLDKNLWHYISNVADTYMPEKAINSGTLLCLSFSFDASLTAIFLPLLSGNPLIMSKQKLGDLFKADLVKKYAPYQFLKVTPAQLHLLEDLYIDDVNPITRRLVVGGEALNYSHLEFLTKRNISVDIINEYGPTEATIGCTWYTFNTLQAEKTPDNNIPIGRPFEGVSAYVMDEDEELLPIGIEGELYIGGEGVTAGYLNNPQLTADRFMDDEYANRPEAKMYRTGDLVKWLPDGNIQFLGRVDDQVKIRGHRIELKEVESNLNQISQVHQNAVVAQKDALQMNKLTAYFVPEKKCVEELESKIIYEQVDSWQDLYESQYGDSDEPEDVEFNLVGWGDSFTGQDIPKDQMREWLNDIIDVIKAHKPENLLEIGCGSGLMFYELAGNLKKYIGTDFSASAIENIKSRVASGVKDYGATEFFRSQAHEVKLPAEQPLDTILINSVIQYFPGEEYLSKVIDNCVNMISDKGRIIIGDVRDNRLLKSFKGRLYLNNVMGSLDKKEFEWELRQAILAEEELCLHPQYFYDLQTQYPQISHVEIVEKQGEAINELSLYRYTVILHIGQDTNLEKPDWKVWGDDSIEKALQEGHSLITIKDAPNPRLKTDQQFLESLLHNDIETVNDILKSLEKVSDSSPATLEIIKKATESGYSTRFLVNEDPFKLNIVLSKDMPSSVENHWSHQNAGRSGLTNIPLYGEIKAKLQAEVRDELALMIPEYMVPTEMVALDELPTTSNGKVDVKFLSEVNNDSSLDNKNHIDPESELEIRVSEIWKDLLELNRIGLHDDFFQIGGHSLLATRIVSMIRKELQVELSLSDFFEHTTLHALCKFIQGQTSNVTLPAVKPRPRTGEVPLSFAQERLWFMDNLHGTVQYHMHWVFRLKGDLDTDVLEKSLRGVIRRHEVMRTVIKVENEAPAQVVLPVEDWNLQRHDIGEIEKQFGSIDDFVEQEIKKPFNLSSDFMVRAHLISLSEGEHLLVPVLHHISFDGWSMATLVHELKELYNSFLRKSPPTLQPLSLQYSDYAVWQRKYLAGDVLNQKLTYWTDQLQGLTPLDMPTDFRRPPQQSFRGAQVSGTISKELKDKLMKLSQKEGVTLYMTMLAAFNVLLYRYTGQDDIAVGTATAGRQQKEIEGLIGFFINTIVLRNQVDGQGTFKELVQQIKSVTLAGFENQEVPFEKVVEALGVERDMSRNALFQIQFLMQNTPKTEELKFDNVELIHENNDTVTSRFDLNFSLTEVEDEIYLEIVYCLDLFKHDTVERLFKHFVNVLTSIVDHPESHIDTINLLDEEEKALIMNDFSQTITLPQEEKTLIDLFYQQAEKTPDNVALALRDTTLTYKELDERSNKLASYLMERGISKGKIVPLCLDRSFEMIIGILGVLKTGAAYAPIDPEYPQERITYILRDTESKIAISNSRCRHLLRYTDVFSTIVSLDKDWDTIGQQPGEKLPVETRLKDLMYIIYTSGSTGQPKGVLQEHGALTNFILHQSNEFKIAEDDRVLQFYSYCFDPSVEQIFMPLINGAVCVLIPDDTRRDHDLVEKYLHDLSITHLQATPGFLNNLKPGKYNGLRRVVAGGEVCAPKLYEKWRDYCTFYNKYGPTETAISATQYKCNGEIDTERALSIPIGRPVTNTLVRILDKNMNMVPIGVAGDMYIGGVQLARGYHQMPELTREKFVPDEFSDEKGNRLYHTGDLARWMPDGNIDFLGRSDEQIKIRGYRVEPSEIEKVLQKASGIKQCVVIGSQDHAGYNRLVAYVLTDENYQKEKAKEYLLAHLPEYMVPSFFVEIDHIPLTSTSKVDKKALPAVEGMALSNNNITKPRNEVEEKLIEIYKDILEIDQVGIHDNFFEIGGHSLLATRAVSVIRKKLGTGLSLNDFFMYPRVADLSSRMDTSTAESTLPKIYVQPKNGNIPLSFAQERLWFIDKLRGSEQYHMPWAFEVKGNLNLSYLESAFSGIVNRHEILRTVVEESDGKGFQKVLPAEGWKMTVTDWSAIENKDIEGYITNLIKAPFDLAQDFMLRAEVIRKSDEEHIVVVVFHHIAFDGWSVSVLVKELVELYNSLFYKRPAHVPHLSLQYADYALWQRKHLEGKELNKQIQYWKDKLTGVPALQMPTDYPRPNIQGVDGGMYQHTLDKSLADKLYALSKHEETTLYMTMVAAFKVLLHRYTAQQDICIGSPIANRTQTELETMVGFFVNTLALRTTVKGDMTFKDYLQQVKKTTLEAYQYQDAPFERVVEAIGVDRNMSHSPIFQILFVMQNTPPIDNIKLGDVNLKNRDFDTALSRFDIDINVTERNDEMIINWGYCKDLFKNETIVKLAEHYVNLLQAVVDNSQESIEKLKLLSSEEEHKLLEGFNDTAKTYSESRSIIRIFEEQVTLSPDETAITFYNDSLTYAELNQIANKLARHLVQAGVQPNSIVPVCMGRSIDLITSILAILKAGAAYLPLDPEYPNERLHFMVSDSGAGIVLTKDDTTGKFDTIEDEVQLINLDKDWDQIALLEEGNIVRPEVEDQMVYVIYTSGSTGTPKGVVMEEAALINLMQWHEEQACSTKGKTVLQFASLNFDPSFQEIFSALCYGGKLVLIDEVRRRDMQGMLALIKENGVNHLFIPYIVLKNLCEQAVRTDIYPESIQAIFTAGEQLILNEDIRQFFDKTNARLLNYYGPTETQIVVSYEVQKTDFEDRKYSPIGKAISNVTQYVLDEHLNLCPIGVVGELYIGGVALAKEYLNREQLTGERFIQSPFHKGQRLYKTGDLARWLSDGNMEFIGRNDDQVKIRGNRVELGEVETKIRLNPMVRQCVVMTKENASGFKFLVAHVVPGAEYNQKELMNTLKAQLPYYMIPDVVIEHESIPVTVNGKIDKKQLQAINIQAQSGQEYEAPQGKEEQDLANIWMELLAVDQVGRYDNYFDLGGNSIISIQMVSRANLLGYDMEISDLFEYQVIADIVPVLKQRGEKRAKEISFETLESLSATPNQLQYLESASSGYLSVALSVDKALSVAKLQQALNEVAKRHAALRVAFAKTDDQWTQRFDDAQTPLEVVDFSSSKEVHEGLQVEIAQQKLQHLPEDVAFRAILVQTNEDVERNAVILNANYLLVDLPSMDIIADEFMSVLDGKSLGEHIDTYKSRLGALNESYQADRYKREADLWKGFAAEDIPVLNDSYEHFTEQIDLSAFDASSAHAVYQTGNLDFLLGALTLSLRRREDANAIVVGVENNSRTDKVVGHFYQTYPFRLHAEKELCVDELIKQVKESRSKISDHGLGYGVLKYILKEPQFEKNPWNIKLRFHGMTSVSNLSKHVISNAYLQSNFPLTGEEVIIDCGFDQDQLWLRWSFGEATGREQTQRISAEFVNSLKEIFEHCLEKEKLGQRQYTPSDFGLSGVISYEELDSFLNDEDSEKESDDIIKF
ncbi:amino acid adenylation domain-containing protein [Fulvivirga sp. 29W222]|uniref:Amino acid adenylation domain-containing protein n=1 Tax=Fulvivirga marina TaxID=2494733 RepID=A0A937G0A0_9BACT|nr:non-ribosomal peptide synthetase [Fulvivirga marina]MBL6449339.1 amino acid adenylation domain-containing protein [Fulvivirga marina]